MHPEDTSWLPILWRDTPDTPLQSYCMLTVVYGTKPAPFLALRALQQLAHDQMNEFPKDAQTLLQNSYDNDVLFGADTWDELSNIQFQLIDILASTEMSLDKWVANDNSILPKNSQQAICTAIHSENQRLACNGVRLKTLLDLI